MQNKRQFKQGFSLAEAMITLLIVSLILAAIVPIVSKRQATPDKIWNYTQTGVGTDQADVYWGLRDGQTALIGSYTVPDSAAGSRLTMITPVDDASLSTESLKYAIRRPLLAFYQKTSATTNEKIGKISFDQWGNTALGSNTLASATPTSINSTAVTSANEDGIDAGYNDSGSLNTAMGYNALFSNTTGGRNVAVGNDALVLNTTGRGNTAIGSYAGRQILTGAGNTAVGVAALQSTVSTTHNTAIGAQSLKHNTGTSNTAIGSHSMWKNEAGSGNIAIGVNAMRIANYISASENECNTYNIAIGIESLYNNTAIQNVGIGLQSLKANTKGRYNVAIGSASNAANSTGDLNTTLGTHTLSSNNGSYNLALGYGAGFASTAVSEMLYIEGRGDQHVPTDNLIVGSFNSANRYVKINGTLYNQSGGVIAASDIRLKKDIKNENVGLEDILRLNVKSYKFNDDKKQKTHIGVIAQELKKVIPDAVVEGPGNDKYKSLLFVDQSYILFELVNAVKQLHTKIVNNLNRIIALENEVKTLKAENKQLKKELSSVEVRLSKLEKAK